MRTRSHEERSRRMSYTEIYGFDKSGDAYMQEEVQNAWRGAMAVWSILEENTYPRLTSSLRAEGENE